ncbi:hypothetical protein AMTRI_Chr13g88440 [Amborella trichopoda]
MIVLSWNVRGLGSARRRRVLRRLIRRCRPNIVVLQETKLSNFDLSVFRSFWGHHPIDFGSVAFCDLSGGLLTIWDPAVVSGILFHSSFHDISLSLTNNDGFVWCLSNVYDPNVGGTRRNFLAPFRVSSLPMGAHGSVLGISI